MRHHFSLVSTLTRLQSILWSTTCIVVGIFVACFSQHSTAQSRFVTTPDQAALAQAVAQNGVPEAEIIASAPPRYTVKSGDTLWDISTLYLRTPWRWPVLWGMNKQDIQNPHLIYPGQVLVLTRQGGFARLGLADGVDGLAELKLKQQPLVIDESLSPKIRSEPLPPQPISSIKLASLKHFMTQPLVVEEANLAGSGYVFSQPDSRVFAAKDDTFYARGIATSSDTDYQLYRPSRPLKDPETGKTLAYEAYYLGTAQVLRAGDPSLMKVITSKEEIARGDRLLPLVRDTALNAVPRSPSMPVAARVMSSYNGVEYAGSNMVITLNKGRKAGLETGHVLALWRTGERVVDPERVPTGFWARMRNEKTLVQLPDEQYGKALVFRVFDSVAYALVLGTTQPVNVGDRLTQP